MMKQVWRQPDFAKVEFYVRPLRQPTAPWELAQSRECDYDHRDAVIASLRASFPACEHMVLVSFGYKHPATESGAQRDWADHV